MINDDCQAFVRHWNSHPLSELGHKQSPEVRPLLIFYAVNGWLTVALNRIYGSWECKNMVSTRSDQTSWITPLTGCQNSMSTTLFTEYHEPRMAQQLVQAFA